MTTSYDHDKMASYLGGSFSGDFLVKRNHPYDEDVKQQNRVLESQFAEHVEEDEMIINHGTKARYTGSSKIHLNSEDEDRTDMTIHMHHFELLPKEKR